MRFVGEPVAVVITDGRYQGEDAADLVSVDYDPLPAVVGPAAAVKDETLLFPAAGTNVALANPVSTDDAPFDACEVVVEQDIVNQRVACLPMEGRATAASCEDGKLTVWPSSQNAQVCRLICAAPWAWPRSRSAWWCPTSAAASAPRSASTGTRSSSPGRPGRPAGRCAGPRPAARTWSA